MATSYSSAKRDSCLLNLSCMGIKWRSKRKKPSRSSSNQCKAKSLRSKISSYSKFWARVALARYRPRQQPQLLSFSRSFFSPSKECPELQCCDNSQPPFQVLLVQRLDNGQKYALKILKKSDVYKRNQVMPES